MGNRGPGTKALKRLQLRREVIRHLADDTLARVAGGLQHSGCCESPTEGCSPCMPSKG